MRRVAKILGMDCNRDDRNARRWRQLAWLAASHGFISILERSCAARDKIKRVTGLISEVSLRMTSDVII